MQSVDFFSSRIDAIINSSGPLAVLFTWFPWSQIEAAIAAKFEHQNRFARTLKSDDMFGISVVVVGGGRSNAGRPKLPIRLMVSLLYLKNSFNLSDEELVTRWCENIVWQYFSGMHYLHYYEHRQPCDATQIGHFRKALVEDGIELLLKATIDTAVAIEAVRPQDLEWMIVDTTVQEKAIANPMDSRLLEIARHKIVSAAKRAGIQLKRPLPKKARPCAGWQEATSMPNSSAVFSARSNASASSWASSSGRRNKSNASVKAKPENPMSFVSRAPWQYHTNTA